jgi:pimeloyl-ACP methyl ester carboxylesterase
MRSTSRLAMLVSTAAVAIAVPVANANAALPVPYGSAAVAQGELGELNAPNMVAGANTGCKPSKAHPYPVVLVHATLSDEAQNWVTLSPLLANAGYCVFAFNYGATNLSEGGRIDGLGDNPTSAGQLSSFINKVLAQTGGTQVDLVGHSQGGLMPNYYIKFLNGAAKVHTFVALAPSNHGTTEDGLVTLINSFPIAPALGALISDIGAPALVQQEVGSAFETKTFAGGDTVPGPRYVVIETTHDEVVTPYTNAFLNGPNVTNITVQNQCPNDRVGHIGMFEDSPSLQDVLNQLGPDSPSFKPTCANEGEGL